MSPTSELYESLQVAYEHLNQELFSGELPEVIITVQRKKKGAYWTSQALLDTA